MDALDAGEKRRHALLFGELAASLTRIEETPDGYAFRFPSDANLFLRIAEWITLEGACCPFLSFGLDSDGKAGSIRLRLSGGEGVKEFLKHEFPMLEARQWPG